MIPANEKWQNQQKHRKSFFYQGKKCFKASSVTLSASFLFLQPPQHICMKKINLYKQNVTMDEASPSIRALKRFIGPSVKGPELLATSWPVTLTPTHPGQGAGTQCHTHAGEGKRDPAEALLENRFRPGDDETVKVKDTSHSLRRDYSYP